MKSLKTIAACTFLILLGSLLPYSYKGVSAQSKIDINQHTKGVLDASRLGGGPYLHIPCDQSGTVPSIGAFTHGCSIVDVSGNTISTGVLGGHNFFSLSTPFT